MTFHTLEKCLKNLGKAFRPEEAELLRKSASQRSEDGQNPLEASKAAVSEILRLHRENYSAAKAHFDRLGLPTPTVARPAATPQAANAEAEKPAGDTDTQAGTGAPSPPPVTAQDEQTSSNSGPTTSLGVANPPRIAKGANTPKAFSEALLDAGKATKSAAHTHFIQEFAKKLHAMNPKAFADMDVHILNDEQWKAEMGKRGRKMPSIAGYDFKTNSLFINSDKVNADNIVDIVVHEAGHFAEKFALGMKFTQNEWESLSDAQRVKARLEYDPNNKLTGSQLKYNANARGEWVAFQFSRVVRGDTAGMGAQLKTKLEKWLNVVRDLVRKYRGNENLSTAALDAKILEALQYNEETTASTEVVTPQSVDKATTETAPTPKGEKGSGQPTVVSPPANSKKGRKISVGTSANGVDDLLNVIEELGGIQHPDHAKNPGGEYNGYKETMSHGLARLLIRRNDTASRPDQLLKEFALNPQYGYKFDSVDALYAAIEKAVEQRKKARKETNTQAYADAFERAFLNNEQKFAYQKSGKAISIDDLSVGDSFEVNGEKFTVKDINEDGTVTIKDGITRDIPAGTVVYPDNGKVKKGTSKKKAIDFLDGQDVDQPAENDAPEATTPPAEAKPPAPKKSLFDSTAGRQEELPGTDVDLSLQGEEQLDGERLLKDKIAKKEAQDALDKAQIELPGTEKTPPPAPAPAPMPAPRPAPAPPPPKKPSRFEGKKPSKEADDLASDIFGAPEDQPEKPDYGKRFGAKLPNAIKLVNTIVTDFPEVNSRKALGEYISEFFPKGRPYSEALYKILSSAVETDDTGTAKDWEGIYTGLDTPATTGQNDANGRDPDTNLERDSANADSQDGGGETVIPPSGETDGAVDGRVGTGDGQGAGQGEPRSDAGDASSIRAGSNSELPQRGPGTSSSEAVVGGSEQSEGSSGAGTERIVDAARSDLSSNATPAERPSSDVVARGREESLSERVARQERVEDVGVKLADLDNIRETLPVLLPDQQVDVLKAEQRFFVAKKKGMMFTNGTGTGKTFTGLGIIKRFLKNGAKNVIILVPSSKKAMDWVEDAKHLKIEASQLEGLGDRGKGVNVTTYANFRSNTALWDRDFDLVVYDESHRILENQEGSSTSGNDFHRYLTNHPDKVDLRAAERIIGRQPEMPPDNPNEYIQEANEKEFNAKMVAWHMKAAANLPSIRIEKERLSKMTKVVFLSATPFAYHKTLSYAEGYLFDLPDDSQLGNGYNVAKGFDRFLVSNFGYQMKNGKLNAPSADVDLNIMERALSDRMQKEGSLSGRSIDVPYDYSREFVLVDSKIGQEISRGIGILSGWEDANQNKWKHLPALARGRFNYLYNAQLLEAIKAERAIDRIREHIALGRKVILFHTYVNATPFHPFQDLASLAVRKDGYKNENALKEVVDFQIKYPELENLDLGEIMNPLARIEKEFGKEAVFFNGNVSGGKRMKNVDAFNADGSGVNLIVAQMESMKEGVSAHDVTGGHQRVVMNLALPIKPTDAIQTEGRAYRVGVRSNAIDEYLVLHTSMEKWQFGSKINERVRTPENLALGSIARNLQNAFKQGYVSPNSDAPSTNQGIGGKEADRADQTASDFDRAKTYYFGRQKKTSKTKSAEGIDYFATPEPVGLKMVEFARLQPNEKALEPSAGHGAIARFFPATTKNTYVEPSMGLAEELRIKVETGDTHVSRFEDLHEANKFDGVVMNPPFGTGGSTAIKHLAKAAGHLRDGGRLVALIPEGPAADKAFNKWYDDANQERPQFVKVAEFGLPTSTFERAGTKVKTRIVVIDRIDNLAARVAVVAQSRIDLAGETIKELFDSIENVSTPARYDPPRALTKPIKGGRGQTLLSGRDAVLPNATTSITEAPQKQKAPLEAAQFNHTKTGKPVYVAKTSGNMSPSDFSAAKQKAIEKGGYYSSFRGIGAVPGFHFNNAEARDAFLSDPDFAGAPEPVDDRPGFFYRSESDSLRENGYKVVRQIYERRPHATAQELALGILETVDEEKATKLALDGNDNGVPGDVKTILYGELIDRQAKIMGDAKSTPLQVAKAQRRLQQLDNVKAPQFTAIGQTISALQQVYKNAGAGGIAEYIAAKKQERDKTLGGDKAKKEMQAAKDALDKVNAEAIEKATADLNKMLKQRPLTKPLWQKYRDFAAEQVYQWVDGLGKPPKQLADLHQFTKDIVSEIKSRLAAEMGDKAKATKAPERNPSDLLRDAIMNRDKYADAFATVRAKLVEKFGENSEIVEQADITMGNIGLVPYSKRILDKALKQAFEARNTNIREIAKLHYTQSDRINTDLADALSDIAGLSSNEANKLADEITKRMQELTSEAKKRAILAIVKRNGAGKKTQERMNAVQRAVLLNNYGALSVNSLADIVAKELKLPHINPAQMKEIAQIGDRIETATTIADKARAELDMLKALRVYHGFSKIDVATSIWYANMLAGYTTLGGNIAGNVMQSTAQMAALMATSPKQAMQALRGWITGFGEGFTQSAAIMKTGRGSAEIDAKSGEAGNTLELVDFKRDFPDMNKSWAAARQNHVKAIRYVTRIMKATDALFYYPAREAYSRVAVSKLLAANYEGKELKNKVWEFLNISPSQLLAAKTQAESEGFTGLDAALRVSNLIESARQATEDGTEIYNQSSQSAKEATYNQEPEGWAGILYQAMVPLVESVRPGGIPVLKAFLPFLRIPTNLFNASMNFTPIGSLRAFRDMPKKVTRGEDGKRHVERREFTSDERARLHAQAIGGSLLMGGLAALALAGGGDDDEERWFDITATGPDDYKKRQQLEATGWKSHSIKMGDVWISYKDSPLLIPLAVTGNVVDAVRFGKQADELALSSKILNGLMTAPRAIFETSMLSGLGQLMEYASGKATAKQLTSFLARTASSIVLPNTLSQIDRQFSPEVRESNGPLGTVGAALPFVRNTGTARSDVLGDPVSRNPLSRFGGMEGNDPLREVLRDKQVYISVPSRSTKMGDKPMDEATYLEFVRMSGERIKARLTPFVATLRNQKKEQVEKIVDRITHQERERAKNLLRSRPQSN